MENSIPLNLMLKYLYSGGSRISQRRVCTNPRGVRHRSGGYRISPRCRRQPSRGRQHKILPNFPKNCMKLQGFGPRGAHIPRPPSLKPPDVSYFFKNSTGHQQVIFDKIKSA